MCSAESQPENGEAREPVSYRQYTDGEWQKVSGPLPDEMAFHMFVNGEELATLLCTPDKLNCLVLGFLRSESLITGMSDIAMMRVCQDDSLAEVRLTRTVKLPDRRTITSGCGGGVTFDLARDIPPVSSDFRISPKQVLDAMLLLRESTGNRPKGLHVSALSNGHELMVRAEDIGRHNTLDKIWGECMLRRISTQDSILVTTGRISSEMLVKAAKMNTPVVASLNSATKQAVSLGNKLGVTVVGYARGARLSVYSCAGRISGCPDEEEEPQKTQA